MKSKGKLVISVSYLFLTYFILLFFFFQPSSIDLLMDRGMGIWKIVDYAYLFTQFAFAGYGYLLWIFNRKSDKTRFSLLVMAHVALLTISHVFNGSISGRLLGLVFRDVGFCILCLEMIRSNKKMFLRAGGAVFAFYTIMGICSVYLFPGGFFHASSTNQAVYALGAKNNGFPYYYGALFFMIASSVDNHTKLPKKLQFFAAIMVVAGLICNSMNTVMCLLLVLVLYYCVSYFAKALSAFAPTSFLAIFVCAIVIIYIGMQSKLVVTILSLLNRNTTFSGRDELWKQALQYFSNNPLFGSGDALSFDLGLNRFTGHAHSKWLDMLAKSGAVPAVFLVAFIASLFKKADKYFDRLDANTLMLMLLIYMLHMSFDTYNYYYFLIFVITTNAVLNNKESVRKEIT